MSVTLAQHQIEIRRNREIWRRKPLLREIYAGFYRQGLSWIDRALAGPVVEIGSGIGHLKEHWPSAISTDLGLNPWLDLVCDGYELPFCDKTVSHLVLFDVFHHLRAPGAFLKEARRVLVSRGRVILIEPYLSWSSFPVYALLHPEPLGWGRPIDPTEQCPRPREYYAAQGNATRLFFRREAPGWPTGWTRLHAGAFASFSYLLSGGFSRPAMYPRGALPALQWMDANLSRWPGWFGARCLVVLQAK